MTRRDFILIAEALAAAKPTLPPSETRAEEMRSIGALEGWENACERVASALCSTNPRFDRARFLKACGVGCYQHPQDGHRCKTERSPVMDYITDGGEHMEIPRATTDALVERTLIYRCDECGGCYHLNTGATWEAVEVAILKIDPDAACCGAESPEGYRCTRRPDHGGNHLACGPGGLDNVAEEWAP